MVVVVWIVWRGAKGKDRRIVFRVWFKKGVSDLATDVCQKRGRSDIYTEK